MQQKLQKKKKKKTKKKKKKKKNSLDRGIKNINYNLIFINSRYIYFMNKSQGVFLRPKNDWGF